MVLTDEARARLHALGTPFEDETTVTALVHGVTEIARALPGHDTYTIGQWVGRYVQAHFRVSRSPQASEGASFDLSEVRIDFHPTTREEIVPSSLLASFNGEPEVFDTLAALLERRAWYGNGTIRQREASAARISPDFVAKLLGLPEKAVSIQGDFYQLRVYMTVPLSGENNSPGQAELTYAYKGGDPCIHLSGAKLLWSQ